MSVAELQEQNSKLRAELARLEALAASLDDSLEEKYNFSALTSNSLTDLEEIKEAFDRFDTDSSGFVDKDELAGLAANLGELWDDQELNDAFAAIDISGDNKISLNEFARWWNLSTRSKVQKSNMKLNILRAKLVTKTFRKGIPEMMRRLSEQKVQDDWVNHRVLLDIDSSAQPAAFLHATLKFLPADRSHFTHFSEKTNILIQYLLVPKPGQSDAQRKAAADQLTAALNAGGRKADEPAYVHVQGPYTVVVLGFHASDPLDTARSLGLDLNNFVRGTNLKIEFGKPLADLFRPDATTCLAEMLKLKFELNVSFRKALMYALVEAKLPGAPVALFFSLLEKTDVSFRFGSVMELLSQAQPPEGYDVIEEYKRKQVANREIALGAARVAFKAAAPDNDMPEAEIDALLAQAIDVQQQAELQQLQMLQQGPRFLKPSFYLQKGYQADLKGMYLDLISGVIGKADQWVSDLITILKDNFVEVKQVHVRSPAGLDVEVQLQNFFTFDLFPTIIKDENGKFDVKRE